jgi:hypothetical protein
MLRSQGFVALAAITLACARVESSPGNGVALYRLISVGGHPVATQCSDEELRASRYELSANRWVIVDTVFKDCTDSLRPAYTRVRSDSGVFSLHGDTIVFENPAANLKLGEARVVLMGLLRNDTLTTWGSKEDGGDYIFVRRPQ